MNVSGRLHAEFGSRTRAAWKPAVALMVLAPFVAEVLSGAMSLATYFSPMIVVPFVLIVYGTPILAIREVAVRRQFGVPALWCLGLVYGLYNEGLLALTVFHPFDAPIAEYASYGVVGNVRIPFTVFISSWHALISVVLPVLLVHHLFPATAARPWLSRSLTWISGSACIVFAVVGFFGVLREDGEYIDDVGLAALSFSLLVVVAAALWLAAGRLRGVMRVTAAMADTFSWKPFVYGALCFGLVNVIPFGFAGAEVHWPLFVLYFLVLAAVGVGLASRHPETTPDRAVTFALGAGMAAALLGFTFGNVLPATLFGACFAAMLFRIMRHRRVRRS